MAYLIVDNRETPLKGIPSIEFDAIPCKYPRKVRIAPVSEFVADMVLALRDGPIPNASWLLSAISGSTERYGGMNKAQYCADLVVALNRECDNH